MGLQDRDYWIEKYNKNTQYNPKEFRSSNIVRLNTAAWKKYILAFLTALFLFSSIITSNDIAKKTITQIYNNIPSAIDALFKGL